MKKKLMSILLSAAVSVSMVAGMGAVVYADTAEDNEAIKLEKVKEADSNGEEPVLDINEIYGLSPAGDLAELAGDLSLTDAEVQKISFPELMPEIRKKYRKSKMEIFVLQSVCIC